MTGYYALFAMTRSSLDNNGSSTISPRSGKAAQSEPKRAKASQGGAKSALTGTLPLLKPGSMRTADLITQKLTEAFSPQSLNVVDESHQHEGHAGHRPGGQTHFRIYIVSEQFKGKTRLERHRLINGTLSDELAGSVHALAIHAAAPGEGGV
jgi:BolA family transcriptional regulator, general stress-responsive regulator